MVVFKFEFKFLPTGRPVEGGAVGSFHRLLKQVGEIFEKEPTETRSAFAPHRPKRSSKASSW